MITITIKTCGYNEKAVLVPQHWLAKLGLTTGAARVCFGQRSIGAKVVPREGIDSIYFSPSILQYLRLRPGWHLKLRCEDDRLHIGPLIGIMTTTLGSIGSKGGFPLEQKRSVFFSRFIRAGQRCGALLYVFNPNQVDWTRKLVQGYTFRGQQWAKMVFPLPDVVWNKIPHRSAEKRLDVAAAKAQISTNKSLKMFPQDYFYKWQMYELLRKEGSIISHLPETSPLLSYSDVLEYLKKYRSVFVKPTSGSHGHGIIRLERKNSVVSYSYHTHNGSIAKGSFHNSNLLLNFLTKNLVNRRYIVQQGLDLAKYRGSPFDIRATVQKDRKGRWQVVGLSAKIARKGGITTHVCNGGKVVPLEWLAKQIYDEPEVMVDKVTKFGHEVATAIEKASGWHLGELGMDIGIDQDRKLWLFEINSKPGRIVFAPEWAVKTRHRSYELLVEYAMYLAGFGEGEGKMT